VLSVFLLDAFEVAFWGHRRRWLIVGWIGHHSINPQEVAEKHSRSTSIVSQE
jgi:hypothetical protein